MSHERSGIRPVSTVAVLILGGTSFASTLAAGDWPQWRGPNRDGVSTETGLLKAWPSEGPTLAWKAVDLGEGYSSVSVSSDRIFTMGNRGREERVMALDLKDGKELWSRAVGPAASVDYPGPRSTPTIDGDLLFTLGVNGDLVCLETTTGNEVWRKDLQKEFRGSRPGWGYSESPLVDGERVLVTPGGKEATVVALNKKSGGLIWKASIPRGKRETAHELNPDRGDGAQYSSIIIGQVDGEKQYIQFLETGVAGISAKEGKFLWRYNKTANDTANIATPVFRDRLLFTASGYGVGGGLVKLSREAGRIKASEVYFTKRMQNHHGGVVLVGDQLYGFDGGTLRCLDFKTGDIRWSDRSVGKGSVVYADGHLYARSEGGPVALVEATPAGYREKGRFHQPHRSGRNAWPHPVVSNGRLYLRDQDLLLVYELRESSAPPSGR